MFDVRHLILVDAYAIALNHLAGLTLRRKHLGLHGKEIKDITRQVAAAHVKSRHPVEHG